MKAILFDCDGTVYQDLDFHAFYFNSLGLDESLAQECTLLTDEILEGKYLKMNTWIQIPKTDIKDGSQLKAVLSEMTLNEGCAGEIYLGDCWSLCTLLSLLLGIDEKKRQEAFYATRAYQAQKLSENQELIAALKKIRKKFKIYLMTNSPLDTASEFIEKLGLSNVFEAVIYDAHKPDGIPDKLYQIDPALKDHLDELMSIGDHFYNDLMNLKEAGAYTVWMNPYPNIHKPCPDLELTTLDDLVRFLNRL